MQFVLQQTGACGYKMQLTTILGMQFFKFFIFSLAMPVQFLSLQQASLLAAQIVQAARILVSMSCMYYMLYFTELKWQTSLHHH